MNSILSPILQFMSMITITDVIDILIVTFAVYQVIHLIKQTRAETLIKGILFLVVILQLSSWLNLITVNYILQNTMQLGFIALLIMFQPELRKALDIVGRTKFSTSTLFSFDDAIKLERRKNLAINIAQAAGDMSAEKIGALIVIERDTKLGDIVMTGTTLNAEVTSDLLKNIFFPNAPLHDGAVLIRDEKIIAAGCFLPLSQNNAINKQLGTRHRAALGMSESSDAVVVIVSEETGTISIAKDGQLTRHISAKALLSILDNTFCPPQKSSSTFKPILRKEKKNEGNT